MCCQGSHLRYSCPRHRLRRSSSSYSYRSNSSNSNCRCCSADCCSNSNSCRASRCCKAMCSKRSRHMPWRMRLAAVYQHSVRCSGPSPWCCTSPRVQPANPSAALPRPRGRRHQSLWPWRMRPLPRLPPAVACLTLRTRTLRHPLPLLRQLQPRRPRRRPRPQPRQ